LNQVREARNKAELRERTDHALVKLNYGIIHVGRKLRILKQLKKLINVVNVREVE
jgi:hypothetical protein